MDLFSTAMAKSTALRGRPSGVRIRGEVSRRGEVRLRIVSVHEVFWIGME